MNNTIYKYPLDVTDKTQLDLPINAEILCVQVQRNVPCLWALVNTNERILETVTIETFGSGHPYTDGKRKYIGTYQLYNGEFVGHVFQRLSEPLQD